MSDTSAAKYNIDLGCLGDVRIDNKRKHLVIIGTPAQLRQMGGDLNELALQQERLSTNKSYAIGTRRGEL